MTKRLNIGPIHRVIEEHLRALTVALFEQTGIEPHLTIGVSRALGQRMQMLPGERMELLTEAGVATVAVADDSAINILRIDVQPDDPDRLAFGLIDAFTKKVTGEMAIPKDFGPLTIKPAKPVCACGDPKCGQPGDATPTLIEGLTLAQCRDRWLVNRSEQEVPSGAKRPVYDLTPAQIEAGKRYRTIRDAVVEAFDASLLRALVKTSDAERKAREPSVVVDMEDE